MILEILSDDLAIDSMCESCNEKKATFCMLFNQKVDKACAGIIAISQLCDECSSGVVLDEHTKGKLVCKDRTRPPATYPPQVLDLTLKSRVW